MGQSKSKLKLKAMEDKKKHNCLYSKDFLKKILSQGSGKDIEALFINTEPFKIDIVLKQYIYNPGNIIEGVVYLNVEERVHVSALSVLLSGETAINSFKMNNKENAINPGKSCTNGSTIEDIFFTISLVLLGEPRPNTEYHYLPFHKRNKNLNTGAPHSFGDWYKSNQSECYSSSFKYKVHRDDVQYPQPVEILPGTYQYPFAFLLPLDLPPSMQYTNYFHNNIDKLQMNTYIKYSVSCVCFTQDNYMFKCRRYFILLRLFEESKISALLPTSSYSYTDRTSLLPIFGIPPHFSKDICTCFGNYNSRASTNSDYCINYSYSKNELKYSKELIEDLISIVLNTKLDAFETLHHYSQLNSLPRFISYSVLLNKTIYSLTEEYIKVDIAARELQGLCFTIHSIKIELQHVLTVNNTTCCNTVSKVICNSFKPTESNTMGEHVLSFNLNNLQDGKLDFDMIENRPSLTISLHHQLFCIIDVPLNKYLIPSFRTDIMDSTYQLVISVCKPVLSKRERYDSYYTINNCLTSMSNILLDDVIISSTLITLVSNITAYNKYREHNTAVSYSFSNSAKSTKHSTLDNIKVLNAVLHRQVHNYISPLDYMRYQGHGLTYAQANNQVSDSRVSNTRSFAGIYWYVCPYYTVAELRHVEWYSVSPSMLDGYELHHKAVGSTLPSLAEWRDTLLALHPVHSANYLYSALSSHLQMDRNLIQAFVYSVFKFNCIQSKLALLEQLPQDHAGYIKFLLNALHCYSDTSLVSPSIEDRKDTWMATFTNYDLLTNKSSKVSSREDSNSNSNISPELSPLPNLPKYQERSTDLKKWNKPSRVFTNLQFQRPTTANISKNQYFNQDQIDTSSALDVSQDISTLIYDEFMSSES